MNKKIFAIAAMMLLMPMMAGAQALKGSYFLDNSLDRHQLNPAFSPSESYFQIPVIGNFGMGMTTNMKMSTFLYPADGQLYTFLNKNVSLERFDASLPRRPYADMTGDMNLVNFGWRRGDGFWTVDMGLRIDASGDVPRDLFMFMKKGTGSSGGSYGIGNVKLDAGIAAHASIGYSRDLSSLVSGLRVGAKVRGIIPLAYVGIDFQDVTLTTSPDRWTLSTSGVAQAAISEVQLVDSEGSLSPSVEGIPGPAGWGMSFDLGAEYLLEFDGFINGVSFSAAITDLGFIKYSAEAAQAYTTEGNMDWTGIKISLEEGAMDDALAELKDEFSDLVKFEEAKDRGAFSRPTLPGFYVGVEMPFCSNTMSIGALYHARRGYHYTRNEITLSYNLNPVSWFGLGLNYSFLRNMKNMGCILEFTPRVGPCFYLGIDYFPLEYAAAPDELREETGISKIPTSICMSARFGLAFALGGRK